MIPASIISKLHEKEEAIFFGSLTLKIVKHDGHKTRFLWTEESSEIEGSPTSGECSLDNTRNNGDKHSTISKDNEL